MINDQYNHHRHYLAGAAAVPCCTSCMVRKRPKRRSSSGSSTELHHPPLSPWAPVSRLRKRTHTAVIEPMGSPLRPLNQGYREHIRGAGRRQNMITRMMLVLIVSEIKMCILSSIFECKQDLVLSWVLMPSPPLLDDGVSLPPLRYECLTSSAQTLARVRSCDAPVWAVHR